MATDELESTPLDASAQEAPTGITASHIIRFVGLLLFIALCGLATYLAWPYIQQISEPDGLENLIADIRSAGPLGFVILLLMQFIQIVVAFIPGEVVQFVAGAMYGPWLGCFLIILGCVFSSALVFVIVRRWGAPLVRDLVSTKHMDKFIEFEKSDKFTVLVFVLYLIPAMPKDTFNYLVPLTSMPMDKFLFLTSVARIPGVLMCTFSVNILMDGDYVGAAIVFGLAALASLLGLRYQERIINFLESRTKKNKAQASAEDAAEEPAEEPVAEPDSTPAPAAQQPVDALGVE